MKKLLQLSLTMLILAPTLGSAGARHFTYLYEATTSAPGSVEIENSATFATGDIDGKRFSEFDFRHEFEFGITNRFQASIYVADWNYQTGFADTDAGFNYTGTAVEAIYNLTNPVIDPVGLAVYEEIKAGDRIFESESKLIAQKNIGPFIFAYNATLEAEWQGGGWEEKDGELQQGLGASYELCPSVSVGLEMLYELVFPEWHAQEAEQNFFIGPNVSYRRGQWFATVTALAQCTLTTGEPDFQVRTIVGYAF
jgi:hypothetical protein